MLMFDARGRRGQLYLIGAIVVLGVVARMAAAVAAGDAFQFPDEGLYTDTAYRLAGGQGFGPEYGKVPAYPLFLAVFAKGSDYSILMLRMVQAALAGLGGVALFVLTDRLAGRGAAIGALLLYAADPMLVVAGGLLYPEAVAALLTILLVLTVLVAAERDSLVLPAASGLLLGVLGQLRPVALILLPVLLIWLVASPGRPPARRWRQAVVAGAVCLFTLVPWTYRNYHVQGALVPVSTKGARSTIVSTDDLVEQGITASIARSAWEEPTRFAGRVALEFTRFWELYPTRLVSDDPERRIAMRASEPRLSPTLAFNKRLRDVVSAVSFATEMVLAAVGIAVIWGKRRRETILLIAIVLMFALGYSLFYAKLRYRVPILPLVFVFGGIGGVSLLESVWARSRVASEQIEGVLSG